MRPIDPLAFEKSRVTKPDLLAVRQDMIALRSDLENAIERQTLRLTVRLGAMLGVAIAALATIVKL
jgi:hypothetical protein